MPESQSKDKCRYCGGQLKYEETYRYGGFRREEHYRCQSCERLVQVRIDRPIKERFPTIKDISIEVFNEKTRGITKFGIEASDVLFCCQNRDCKNPGILIGPTIGEMLRINETHREYWESCVGYESSPRGRRKTACGQSFRIKIDIML